ncbi:hypothetical protein GpartN1_g700.t1 [Galdieria partita]|uniref:E3 ubiquitin-protein ligase n=1 Tax=Galdieria partita TaxID=83374 RepID=A0A9C7PR41_9RHOD|nr:hypothetical protein GpartN1_g700.t1 [Galdieria partita]
MESPQLEEELYSSTELAQDTLNGLLQAAALDPLEGQYFQNRVSRPLNLSDTKNDLEEARLAIKVALRGYKRLDISSMPFTKNRNFQMTTEIDISRLQFRVALAVIAHVMCRQCPGSSSLEYMRNLPGNIPRGGVCGTVWKKDELAYKCRTCERDPTCAICVQCFRNGNHEGHDFSIIRTGGGVCDCGDPQAWKPFGFCHKHGGAHSEEEDLISKLPLDLREGISLAVELLGEEFLLDETSNHVKVEIATWWRRIADCGDSFTRLVGMELCKSPGPCIRERTFRFEREDGSRPPFVWIFLRLDGAGMLENDTKNALHSLYFLLITDLVFKRKFLEYFGSLYSLFVDPLYQGSLGLLEDNSSNNTRDHFSVQLFTVPALVPVMIKHGGLIDQLLKILLQLVEAVSYPVRKVETISEDWHSIADTHFGTVHLPKPLAHDKCIDLSRDRGLDTLNRVIYDLRYILTHTNAAAYVMHYRPDLLALFVRILSLLQGMNAEVRAVRYHVERESDIWSKAISLELDFNHLCELLLAGFVFNKLEDIMIDTSDIEEGTGTENLSLSTLPKVDLRECRKRALYIIRKCLDEWIVSEKQRESILLDSPFDVSSGAVSVHYPLHRFLALLATEAIRRYNFTFYEALGQSDQNVLDLAEHILRVQALLVQVKAGMWKRNGRPMVNRCILYKSSYCQEWFFDLDIAMMQLCCVSKGARAFVNKALEVFGLQSIMQVFKDSWSADGSSSRYFGYQEGVQDIWKFFAYEEYDFMIVQGFIRMLVYITAERVRIGYSDMERLRRKLIHRLCVGDQTHSSLLKTIPRRLTSSSNDEEAISIMGDEDFVSGGNGTDKHYRMFEECLNQVGIFQQPKEMDQGHYRLKDELWQEYDPFYPHYQSRERAIAEERHIQFRRKHHLVPHRLIFPQKSPKTLPLFDAFSSLLDLCREFCRPGGLACSIISRCLAFCREGKDLDGTLNASLYLILFALETTNDSLWKTSLKNQVTFIHSVLICTNEEDRKEYRNNISLAFLLECVQKCSSCVDQHEAAKLLLSQIQSEMPVSATLDTHMGESSSQTKEAKRREMRRKQQEALEKMRKQQEAFLEKQHSLFEQEKEEAKASPFQGEENNVETVSTLEEDHQNICSLCHEVASVKEGNHLVVIGLVQRSNIPMLARRMSRTTTIWSSERSHDGTRPTSETSNHVLGGTPIESSSTAATELLAWEQMWNMESAVDDEYLDHDDDIREEASDAMLSEEEEEEIEDDTEGEEWFEPPGAVHRMTVSGEEWNEDISVDLVGSSTESSLTVGTDWSQLTRTDSSTVISAFLEEDIQKGLDTRPDTLFQSCGHQMHWSCFERYFSWLTNCHAQRLPFDGDTLIDVTHGEFLCPVCRRLANVVIPVMEDETILQSFPYHGEKEIQCLQHVSLRQLEQIYHQQCQHIHQISKQVDSPHIPSPSVTNSCSSEVMQDSLMDILFKSLCFDHISSDRNHVPFPSASSVPSNLRRRTFAKTLPVISKGLANLLNCLIYTIMTQEVAARSGHETIQTFIREMHFIVLLLRKFILTQYPQHCKSEFCRLWMTYLEPVSAHVYETQLTDSIDAFTLFAFALLLWPENWNEEIISLLLRLCFLLNFRNPLNVLLSHGDSGILSWTTNAVVFVRRCVLFLNCIFGSSLSPCAIGTLSEVRGLLPCSQELSMAYSLGLIPRESTQQKEQHTHYPLLKEFAQKWQSLMRTGRRDWRYPLRPLTLISLPKVFQDLVEALEGKACKRCHRVSKKQTLCLVCGDLLCMSEGCDSYPFERSVTQFAEFETMRLHAHECAAGIGIFLLLKATWVLLIRNNRTAIWGSPYLDEFGEEDMELHRGKPLYLNQERMEVLQRLFVTQGFDYDARILNKSTQFQYIALFR